MTESSEPPQSGDRAGVEVRYHHSPNFGEVLGAAGCSILVSTYQAGQLVAIGSDRQGVPVFSFRRFDQAMGVALGGEGMAVAARGQVWFLKEHSDLAPRIEPAGQYDRCFLPRTTNVTGSVQLHELAYGRDAADAADLWVVNTRFSCLVGLHEEYNFVPRWRPPFITELAAQDRCHLNGLAMRDHRPAYVTVMGQTDEPGGWRAMRNDSGAILEVPSGEAVTTGLAMPHSPRWYRDRLYVLNSGYGRLETVDVSTGQREIVALLPGYARGLALHGDLAFIGLSRIRETAIFGGAPIAAHHDQLKCGVGVVDITTGNTIATFEFENGVEEIFDIQVVPDARAVTLGGSNDDDSEVWLLPHG